MKELELTYEETIELEESILLKNKAKSIYNKFIKIKLSISNYKSDGRFVLWEDSHNVIYIALIKDVFHFECRFLHENYNIQCTPSGIFDALKSKYRGIEHLEAHVCNL